MTSQEFLVPSDIELLDALGVASEATDGVDSTRSLRLASGADDEVHLTCDIPGRSIRFEWCRKGARLLDIFREDAARLSVKNGKDETVLTVAFESGSLAGELRIQVWPTVCIDDRLLTY